jgi:hypothetical protein
MLTPPDVLMIFRCLYVSLMVVFAAPTCGHGKDREEPVAINPSFEAGVMPDQSGYGAIEGWTGDNIIGTDYGLNESGGSFADNGVVPHGRRVAFLQHNGALRQTVTGFVIGQKYWLVYVENARGLCCDERAAILKVLIGQTIAVPEHVVAIVGQSNPYRLVISEPFVATESEMALTFSKGGYGDSAVLLDDVRILSDRSRSSPIDLPREKISVLRVRSALGWQTVHEDTMTPEPGSPWELLLNRREESID